MEPEEEKLAQAVLALKLLQQGVANNERAIEELKTTVNALRDDRIRGMERTVTVSEERVDRLQKVVYGVTALVVTQMATLIIGIILWVVKK